MHSSVGAAGENLKENVESSDVGPGKGLVHWLKRLWYNFLICFLGGKWSLVETVTRHRKLNFDELPKMDKDETVVITGGARGIGAEVVKQCLQLELRVIIGCRKPSAGEAMVQKLRESGITSGTTEVLPLDLNSLNSVREFAQSLLSRNISINCLINNAGVMFSPFNVTVDGYESQFQTNYLSHFLLTTLLLPALHRAGKPEKPSRILNVSSAAQYGGQIDFANIDVKKYYSPHLAYMNSKLLQVVSTVDLNRRIQDNQMNIRVYSLHPGVVKTELYQYVWWVNVFGCVLNLLYRTPEEGADGVVYVAFSPNVSPDGGSFYANCVQQPVNPLALNLEVQEKLYKRSMQLCHLDNDNSMQEKKPLFTVLNRVSP